jgi:hypothetical protein
MPASATVVHITKEGFQRQYITLWAATEAYLDGRMQTAQMQSFEMVMAPEFIASVAQTRLFKALIGTP